MAAATFTRQEVEHTIIELIRRKVVEVGHLPDVRAFAGNLAGYVAARQAQVAGGKDLIDVFGIGSNKTRGEKFYHRIFLNLRQYNNGTVSHWSDSDYIDTQSGAAGNFDRNAVYGSTTDILYDIRSVVNSETGDGIADIDRLCFEIVFAALTKSMVGIYLPVWDESLGDFDPSRRFLIQYQGAQEIKVGLERLMTFLVHDVWLDGEFLSLDTTPETLNIPPLTQVLGDGIIGDEPPTNIIDVT